MKKNLPPISLEELRPPNGNNHTFFGNWQTNPFKHDAIDFELVNAWWLSEAALLVYGEEAFVNHIFEGTGLKQAGFEVQFFALHNVQCFVAHNDQFIIVCFRGTEINDFWGSVMDVATDSKFIPVQDGFGGQVHRGFQLALDSAWEAVRNRLSQIQNSGGARTLWVTGHSLGAAIATLVADRITREGSFEVRGLYTYGSPRIGDVGFKNRLAQEGLSQRTFRFVNNSDIVTKVPPPIFYTHVGSLKFLDSAGQLHSLNDESQIAGEIDASQSLLQKFKLLKLKIPRSLADHAPICYAINIWNNYEDA